MQNTTRLLESIDRSYSGPFVEEKDFDLEHVATGVTRVLQKYDIKFNPDHIVQHDDELNDRLFEAAIDFLLTCGVYNTSTKRLITFTREEIEEAIKWAPTEVTIGEGPDARVFRTRGVEDPTLPQVSGGPIGTPLSEDQWLPIMQSYWQEPIIDLVVPGTFSTVFGREVRSKSPLEIIASWQEAAYVREAARRAGRPGTAAMCVEMAISDIGHLSAIGQDGFRPTDVHVVAMIGEMKTNNELLNKIAHSIQQNGVILGFYNPILGGLAGPPEGVALLDLAGFLAMHVLYMPASVESCPTHPFNFNSTDPRILSAVSTACAAYVRNTGRLVEFMTSPVGGPCTNTVLYECIGMAATASACGASRVLGVRSGVGIIENHCTGLEARFNGEVAHAAAGLSREEVDQIVKKAVSKYEPMLEQRPIGKAFSEAYDPITLRPTAEWQAVYDRVKDEAASWGLPFK